jgi:hypothetical protein
LRLDGPSTARAVPRPAGRARHHRGRGTRCAPPGGGCVGLFEEAPAPVDVPIGAALPGSSSPALTAPMQPEARSTAHAARCQIP